MVEFTGVKAYPSEGARGWRERIVGGVVVVILACTIGWLVSRTDGRALGPDKNALAASVVILVCGVPLLWRAVTGRFDLFEPIVLMSLMAAVLFGVRPIAMIITDNFSYIDRVQVRGTFSRAVGAGLLGTITMIVGYELARFVSIRKVRRGADAASGERRYSATRLKQGAVAATCLGVLLFAFQLLRSGSLVGALSTLAGGRSPETISLYTGSSEYLVSAPVLGACAAIAVLAISPQKNRATTAWLVLAVMVSVGSFFLLGIRRFIIPSVVIPIVVAFLVSGRRPSIRIVVPIGLVAFIVLATIPYQRSQGAREQAGGAAQIFADAFSNPLAPAEDFILSYDTAMIPALAMEIDSIDKTGSYTYGRATVGDFLLAPIPSAVFPKPETARNQMLTDVTGGPCQVASSSGCPDFSVVGTFYQEGALIGVAVGMFLLGLAAGGAWGWLKRSPRNPYAIIVVATAVVELPILIRAGFMPPAAWFMYFAAPSAAIVYYASRRHRAR